MSMNIRKWMWVGLYDCISIIAILIFWRLLSFGDTIISVLTWIMMIGFIPFWIAVGVTMYREYKY